jgi:superfamily I DNA and/or RNA helicase
MKQILQSYLRRLTNLTTRNKSLLLLRLGKQQFIDVHDFHFLLKKPSFHVVESLMTSKATVPICELTDSRDEEINLISRQLKQLSRVEKYIFEERGSKDLYVGWPFVEGKFGDGTPVRCPLIFFPVELTLIDNTWNLSPRQDVSTTFNKSFLLAYSHYNNVPLGEDFIEMTLDDVEDDIRVFRTAIYNILKDSPVELNFNQETFIDELRKYKAFTKSEFATTGKSGMLKLQPHAVLGIFPQAGSYLVPDYRHLIEEQQFEDIESFFSSKIVLENDAPQGQSKEFYHFLNRVKEEDTFTAFKQDVYQENALKAIKRGHSLVVQGPPGTGKSQLICNLISDFIARGKRVLLVCQKRAALDVVYQRLREGSLADFVALVHDFKNDRKDIFRKINAQVERIDEYKAKNSSLDAMQLERAYLQASRRIDQITEELEEFKEALFDEKEAGISVKELYLKSDREGPAISIRQEYRNFTYEKLAPFEQKLTSFYTYSKQFDREGYTWRNRKRFAGYGLEDLRIMQEILNDIPDFQSKVSSRIDELLGQSMDLKTAQKIDENKDGLNEMLDLLGSDQVYEMFCNAIENRDAHKGIFPDLLWLKTVQSTLLGCFDAPGPELSIDVKALGSFQKALNKKMQSRRNLLSHINWLLFSKDKAWIYKVLDANGLRRKGADYRLLEKMVDYRLNLEHNITKLKNIKWLMKVPEFYLRDVFEQWFEQAKRAVSAYLIFERNRNFKEYFNLSTMDRKGFFDKIKGLQSIAAEIPDRLLRWQKYFRDARIEMLLADERLKEKMIESLNADFDALCDYDNLKQQLTDAERALVDRLVEFEGIDSESQITKLFYNSVWLAWIDHIETKFPILRSTNSLKFKTMQKELQQSIKEKLKVSKEITLLRTRERTYHNLEYNRLNNLVTYRELTHQVTKRRSIWPIRKLVANYEQEVFDLLPCWMASPDSVSAMFPMEVLFDLVIFDEASQCFAEQGVPAMYRGRQVVVAGDSRQLSPFDLYKVRWEEPNEESSNIALEVDSLLDLSAQHLMQVHLRGHYRSQSLELIDFSNTHFYDGKLSLLPDKHILDRREPAIDYIKVDGRWEKQTNHREAKEVVQLVERLIAESPDKTIGIVTFNVKQQDLIMDMLEEKSVDEGFEIPGHLFVKNIENVQGDERDIIIFSIAYAPDDSGRMQHHFGSLNIEKGENRLNVAVTRAKEKIVVVASIMPQQLVVDEARNEGPRLLRKYLEYARQVSSGGFKPHLAPREDRRTDWYLKHKLKGLVFEQTNTFEICEEMPFADLTVKNGNGYLGLILTDDEPYHQSISIKDMHVYTPFTLAAKHWKFMGFYSRDYWYDKERIKENLLKFSPSADI